METSGKQVVVITGASAGVGRAVVRAYARQGADLALIARGKAGLEAAQQEAEAAGSRVMIFPIDVADAEAVEQAAASVETELGPIAVWVNNAMVSVFAPIKETTAEEFRRVTEVTYLGYIHGTLAALRWMLPRNRGTIVQVGSALAYRAIPLQAAYSGAKHAIQGFTESLRCELLHDKSNVRVTMVQMPAFNTPQFGWVRTRLPNFPQPVPPIFQPEIAADAILWAAEHAPREVVVGFSALQAVYGNKVAPGLLDHYLARTNYDAQQTDRPIQPDRQDNLWEPVDAVEDFGAHGVFDDRARAESPLWWARQRLPLLAAVGVGAIGLVGAAIAGRRAASGERRGSVWGAGANGPLIPPSREGDQEGSGARPADRH